MCGIAALFGDRRIDGHSRDFEASLRVIEHRGPDGHGVMRSDTLAATHPVHWILGHRRLSIIDLSEAGHQPMPYSGEDLWITYNGEVYNYVELRSELEKAGHTFRSDTDTEVILAAYEEWGTECVSRFVGMFAFIVVDMKRSRVVVVRDRLGIKPLYFARIGGSLAFASEIKQFLCFQDFRPVVSSQAVVDYLVDGVAEHNPGETFYENVSSVPPGCFVEFSLQEVPDRLVPQPYWTIPTEGELSISWEEATREVRRLLGDAVRLRLRSDVPVGSCLSGGMDSSSIVCLMAFDHGTPVSTVSSCYEDPRFDEQEYIDAVNAHCPGSRPIKVFPSLDQLVDDLESIVYHQDEPFISLSIFSQWSVMRAARQAEIPVLLDGQGGDEGFCGYRKYYLLYLKALLGRGRLLTAAKTGFQLARHGDQRLLNLRAGRRYLPKFMRATPGGFRAHLAPGYQALYRNVWTERMSGGKDLRAVQQGDLEWWSVPVLLRYEDRNSMAHSIETRLPFLDHRLIEFTRRLPEWMFFVGGRTKRLIAAGLGDVLPRKVSERRTKMGFESPQSVWLAGGLGSRLRSEIETSPVMGSLISPDSLEVIAEGDQAQFFRVCSVALWAKRFGVAFDA